MRKDFGREIGEDESDADSFFAPIFSAQAAIRIFCKMKDFLLKPLPAFSIGIISPLS